MEFRQVYPLMELDRPYGRQRLMKQLDRALERVEREALAKDMAPDWTTLRMDLCEPGHGMFAHRNTVEVHIRVRGDRL